MNTFSNPNNSLSTGFFQSLVDRVNDPSQHQNLPPVNLMILKCKGDASPSGPSRIRCLFSDGRHSLLGFFAPADRIEASLNGKVVHLKAYAIKILQNKVCVIVRTFDILDEVVAPESIGSANLDSLVFPQNLEMTSLAQTEYQRQIQQHMNQQQQQQQQQKPVKEEKKINTNEYRNPNSRSESKSQASNYTAIADISPYSTKTVLHCRVSDRAPIRTFTNAKGEGKLFSATLVDESGEIKLTGFNEQVDQFYEMLKPGEVFVMSQFRVTPAKKQFSNINHDYELMLTRNTVIEKSQSADDDKEIPTIHADFVTLDKLGEVAPDTVIDVLGVINQIDEVKELISKAGKPYTKRDIVLVDSSKSAVRATLWGEVAKTFEEKYQVGTVIALKGAKVSDFGGRSLSLLFSGQVVDNITTPEAFKLSGWYAQSGNKEQFKFQNSGAAGSSTIDDTESYMLLGDVIENNIGKSEKADFFFARAIVCSISPRYLYYPACTQPDCSKKVIFETDNTWRCEKCNMSIEKPNYRYTLSVAISDETNQIWVTVFDEVGQKILGVDANQLHEYEETNSQKHNDVVSKFNRCPFVFQIRAKTEVFNDVPRVKYQVTRGSPVDSHKESLKLLKEIESY